MIRLPANVRTELPRYEAKLGQNVMEVERSAAFFVPERWCILEFAFTGIHLLSTRIASPVHLSFRHNATASAGHAN